MTEIEQQRKADFKACPILQDYIATMLQDLQLSENDDACTENREPRDTGTIYTLPDETYQKCKADCVAFYNANSEAIDQAIDLEPGEPGLQYARGNYMTLERIAHYFYMVRVGHGVNFTDDGDHWSLEHLALAAHRFNHFDVYFGDDGRVYNV